MVEESRKRPPTTPLTPVASNILKKYKPEELEEGKNVRQLLEQVHSESSEKGDKSIEVVEHSTNDIEKSILSNGPVASFRSSFKEAIKQGHAHKGKTLIQNIGDDTEEDSYLPNFSHSIISVHSTTTQEESYDRESFERNIESVSEASANDSFNLEMLKSNTGIEKLIFEKKLSDQNGILDFLKLERSFEQEDSSCII